MTGYDIAIIGGGPAGYVAAERATAEGLKVVLFEARELGGVCLNEGCIPTKTLLYSAKTYENALHADKYGVRTEGVTFDYARIVARKNKVVRKLVAGVKAKLQGVEIVRDKACIKGRTDAGFLIECPSAAAIPSVSSDAGPGASPVSTYRAANLLICTGSESVIPPIPGMEEAKNAGILLTSREILNLKEIPASLVVVGGGVIGMEFASLFRSLGTKVTVVEQMPKILGVIDHEISEILLNIYAKKGIEFHLSSRVTHIDIDSDRSTPTAAEALLSSPVTDAPLPALAAVSFTDNEGVEHTVSAEKVLISVGRRPVSNGLGLENLGITLNDRRGIATDDKMRTGVPGVYAAGDVTGGAMLAHTAYRQAEVAVNNIVISLVSLADFTGAPSSRTESADAYHPDTMRYDAVPSVVYTNPEVASVGLTLQAAHDKGLSVKELHLPMAYAGRFVAENEGGEGLCKIVFATSPANALPHPTAVPPATAPLHSLADPSKLVPGQVLGIHMIGTPSSEMIWGACLAIERGATLRELQRIIFPHPTVSEIIRETAFTV